MTDIMALIATPFGVALFLSFWVIKAVAGIWLMRRAVAALPVGAQAWAYRNLKYVGLRQRAVPVSERME